LKNDLNTGEEMKKFTFSYFLKIANLNPVPQKSEMRKAFGPSTGGYDFHRSLRLLGHRLMAGEDLSSVLEAAETIKQIHERNSAKAGIGKLARWRNDQPQEICDLEEMYYEGPSGFFGVRLKPDFGIRLSSGVVGVHVWNTKHPKLDAGKIYSALALFEEFKDGNDLSDLAVLSLRDGNFYRLSEAGDHRERASIMISNLEEIYREIQDEGDSGARPEGDRPSPTP
jgi:hypothetical protein